MMHLVAVLVAIAVAFSRGHEVRDGYACTNITHYPFCNTSLTIDERVQALMAEMTIEEKASQFTARSSQAVPRLGLPTFCWGMNDYDWWGNGWIACAPPDHCPTEFPHPPGLASTFNMSLLHAIGQATSDEARASFNVGTKQTNFYSCPGGLVSWGPTINLHRDPRWGRDGEVPSEDPLLTGMYASEFVQGAQTGQDPRYLKMVVTLKHFAVYSYESYTGQNRGAFDSQVDDYNFWDGYMRMWELPVTDAHAAGVMCSYNSINGVPACASEKLRDILRVKFGFDGYQTGDSDCVNNIMNQHHFVDTPVEAVLAALHGGTDLESGKGASNFMATYIPAGVANGTISPALVDTALGRLLRLRFRLGLFDAIMDQPYAKIDATVLGSPGNQQLSLEAARQSIVLLQNTGNILPLHKGGHVAVLGPLINALTVNLVSSVSLFASSVCSEDKNATKAAACARRADAVVVTLGCTGCGGESDDRHNVSLPSGQVEFLQAVAAASVRKPLVVVLINKSPMSIDWIAAHVPAVVEAWIPAESCQAVAEVLFGVVNPSGKLPVTLYPDSYVDSIPFTDMSLTNAPGRTYRYYNGPVLYPFGWGLSYSTFALKSLSGCSRTFPSLVSMELSNAGPVDGTETILAFFHPNFVRTGVPTPIKQLWAFQRVNLAVGTSTTLTFNVTAADLLLVDSDGNRTSVSGSYTLEFTNGVKTSLACNISIAVEAAAPAEKPTRYPLPEDGPYGPSLYFSLTCPNSHVYTEEGEHTHKLMLLEVAAGTSLQMQGVIPVPNADNLHEMGDDRYGGTVCQLDICSGPASVFCILKLFAARSVISKPGDPQAGSNPNDPGEPGGFHRLVPNALCDQVVVYQAEQVIPRYIVTFLCRVEKRTENMPPHCGVHDRPMEFWDVVCRQLVCPNCLFTGAHQGHKALDMQLAAEKEYPTLRHDTNMAADHTVDLKNACQQMDEAVEQIQSKTDSEIEGLRRHVDTIKQELDQYVEMAIQTAQKSEESQREELSQYSKDCQLIIKQLIKGIRTAETATESRKALDVLDAIQTMEGGLRHQPLLLPVYTIPCFVYSDLNLHKHIMFSSTGKPFRLAQPLITPALMDPLLKEVNRQAVGHTPAALALADPVPGGIRRPGPDDPVSQTPLFHEEAIDGEEESSGGWGKGAESKPVGRPDVPPVTGPPKTLAGNDAPGNDDAVQDEATEDVDAGDA
eukprot:gene529-377_t